MNGLLRDGALPSLLRDVYVSRRSGRLRISRGSERYSVRFVKGNILYGESSVPQAHLGELMVSNGLLDEAARREAAEVVGRSGKRLGEVLVGMGAIDKGKLEDALALQVREHLLRVFAWTEGECAFVEQEPPLDAPVTLKLSTGEMVLEAVRLVRNPDAIRTGLGDLDRVVILSSDPLLRFQRITLTPADGFVLSRVDGLSTARQVLQVVPLPAEEAERSLFGLLCIGVIDFLPGDEELLALSSEQRRAEILAAFDGLARRDHFEVLGVARDASQAEVTAAYHHRVRRFHPDAHHDPALADLREQLEAVFERVTAAYEALRRPAQRHEYVASLTRVTRAAVTAPSPGDAPDSPEEAGRKAEEVIAMAESRVKENRQWEAIGLLEGLVTVASGSLRRKARLLLADLHAKNPRSGKAVEEQLTAVIAENPSNVEARLRLARLFHDRQMNSRAAEYLRQVLELEPKHRGALEMMAAIEGTPKGIFGRLFRG